MKYIFFKSEAFDAIETKALFQKFNLNIQDSSPEDLIQNLARYYVKEENKIVKSLLFNAAAPLREKVAYLRQRLYSFLELESDNGLVIDLENRFCEEVKNLRPKENFMPSIKETYTYQLFDHKPYETMDIHSAFMTIQGITISNLKIKAILKKTALKHAANLNNCSAAVGPFALVALDSRTGYLKQRLFEYFNIVNIKPFVEQLHNYYKNIFEKERERLRALRKQVSVLDLLKQMKELKNLQETVSLDVKNKMKDLEKLEIEDTKNNSVEQTDKILPPVQEVTLYEYKDYSGGHFYDSIAEFKDNILTVDYWYLNDQYEQEEWIYIKPQNFSKLHLALANRTGVESITDEKLPGAIINLIKEKFSNRKGFQSFEEFLNKFQIEYSRQRRDDVRRSK